MPPTLPFDEAGISAQIITPQEQLFYFSGIIIANIIGILLIYSLKKKKYNILLILTSIIISISLIQIFLTIWFVWTAIICSILLGMIFGILNILLIRYENI